MIFTRDNDVESFVDDDDDDDTLESLTLSIYCIRPQRWLIHSSILTNTHISHRFHNEIG